jgi:energy-coupling factor transporter ATP-binding protein EcfA2
MTRSIDERAHRARIAPASRLSPETWLKIRWVNPWVVTVLSVAMVFLSPLAAFCLFGAGLVVQLMASTNSPAPVFARREGEAAVFLGKDDYGLPVMLPIGELTRHGMLIGTTGSGKTTAIRTIADSIMGLGGGFCFIDGKSDVTDTYEVLYEIIEKCDRVEDLLVLNFLNPSQSHTFNFMTYGDADFLAEIMTGFLKQAEGDQVYWQERGKILMKAVLTQLVYRRDNPGIFGEYVLTPSEVRRHLSFDESCRLSRMKGIPCMTAAAAGEGPPEGAARRPARLGGIPQQGPGQDVPRGRGGPQAIRVFRSAVGRPPRSPRRNVQQDLRYRRSGDRHGRCGLEQPYPHRSPSLPVVFDLDTSGVGETYPEYLQIALTTRWDKSGRELRRDTAYVRRRRASVPFTLIADEYGSYAVEGFDTILAQGARWFWRHHIRPGACVALQGVGNGREAAHRKYDCKIVMKVEDTDTAKFLAERREILFHDAQHRNDSRMWRASAMGRHLCLSERQPR